MYLTKSIQPIARLRLAPADFFVETVEKVSKQILGREAEKSDLIECATINGLMLGRGQVTPEKDL